MTIIQPNNNKIRFHWTASLVVGLVLLEAVLSIFVYSRGVHLRHAFDQQLSIASTLRAQNVDLENAVYAKINFCAGMYQDVIQPIRLLPISIK